MRRYATAWCFSIGWIVGFLIGIPLDAAIHLATTFSLVGLIIGYVLSQKQRAEDGPHGTAPNLSTPERLRHLEELRAETVITEEEYQAKRRQILDEV